MRENKTDNFLHSIYNATSNANVISFDDFKKKLKSDAGFVTSIYDEVTSGANPKMKPIGLQAFGNIAGANAYDMSLIESERKRKRVKNSSLNVAEIITSEQPQVVDNQTPNWFERVGKSLYTNTHNILSGLGDVISKAAVATAQYNNNVYGGANALSNEAFDEVRENINQGKDLMAQLSETEEFGFLNKLPDLSDLSDKYQGDLSRYYGVNEDGSAKGVTDLFSEGKVGRAVDKLIVEGIGSTPSSLIAAAGGKVGLIVLSLSSAEKKYQELKQTQPHMNEAQMLVNATITGSAEGLAEKIGALPILRNWAIFKGEIGEGAEDVLKEVLKSLELPEYKRIIKDTAKQLGKQMGSEAVEEGVTSIAEIGADALTDREIEHSFNEVIDAMLGGAVGGAVGSSLITAGGRLAMNDEVKRNRQQFAENQRNIKKKYVECASKFNSWVSNSGLKLDKVDDAKELIVSYQRGAITSNDLRAALTNLGVKPTALPSDSEMVGAVVDNMMNDDADYFSSNKKKLKMMSAIAGLYGDSERANDAVVMFMNRHNLTEDRLYDALTAGKHATSEQIAIKNAFTNELKSLQELEVARKTFLNNFLKENKLTESKLNEILQRYDLAGDVRKMSTDDARVVRNFNIANQEFRERQGLFSAADKRAVNASNAVRKLTNNTNGRVQAVHLSNEIDDAGNVTNAHNIIKGNVVMRYDADNNLLVIDKEMSDDVIVIVDDNNDPQQVSIESVTPIYDFSQSTAIANAQRSAINQTLSTAFKPTDQVTYNGSYYSVAQILPSGRVVLTDGTNNIDVDDVTKIHKANFAQGATYNGDVTIKSISDTGVIDVVTSDGQSVQFESAMEFAQFLSIQKDNESAEVAQADETENVDNNVTFSAGSQADETENATPAPLDYTTADADAIYDDLLMQAGDEDIAVEVAQAQADKAQAEIKQLQGKKPKATGDIATDIQALKEHKAKIKAKQEEADKWLSVVNMPKQRAAQQHQEEEETQQQAEAEHQTEEEETRNTEATEQQAEDEAQQQAEQQRLQAEQEAEKDVKQFVDHTEEADVDDVVNDVFEEENIIPQESEEEKVAEAEQPSNSAGGTESNSRTDEVAEENSQDNKENLQKNAEADKQQEKQKEALATNHEKIEQAKEFTIEPAQYTTKKGKVLDMYLVKFSADLSSAVRSSAITLTKELRGWWDKRQGGFMMRSKDDAEQLAKFVTDAHMQSSLSMSDIQAVNDGAVQFSEPISDTSNKEKQNKEYTPVWQYYVSVDEKTGYTILERDDVSGPIPIGDVSFYHYANSPEEMIEILQNPLNGMQDVLDAVRVKLENKIAFRKIKANGHNGYKIGDKVIYKGKQAEIHDFEDYGEYLPVLATGLEPVLYEVANWDEIKKIHSNNREKEETSSKNNGNRLVTDERYEELKERLRKKLYGQMNMGIDPEILTIGVEMAVYHIEKGARKFSEYAKVMIADMGDAVRPYLKAFYNTLRDISEEKKDGMSDLMTPYDEVKAFDIENFDKENINLRATAENNDKEQKAEAQAEIAKQRIKKTRSSDTDTEKKAVNLQGQTGGESFDDSLAGNGKADAELHRQFAIAVKADMLAALDNGTRPYRSILELRKRARELGMHVDDDGRTDILLQELVEDGLVRAAREVVERKGRSSRESYDLICKLYEMQPTIAARSSNRIKMQQYSTPLPMAWIANRFAMANKERGKVLEPTAGNGMLVFTIPVEQVHANELDDTRLDNLRDQGFAEVTQQDATEPFEGGRQYDVVIANPPFGKRDAVEYDGKMITGLDPQITLNALASMKDNGKAAIIIGGNMEYASNGAIKSMKPFFTYLYDHYNVKGVIDMSGSLYAKQGTTYPTRMILIDGRRSDEERAQTAVYPPVESMAIRKAESFDDLYEIINEVLNSNEKTNGTNVLRGKLSDGSIVGRPRGYADEGGRAGKPSEGNSTVKRLRGGLDSRPENVLGEQNGNDTINGRGTTGGQRSDRGLGGHSDQRVGGEGRTGSVSSQHGGSERTSDSDRRRGQGVSGERESLLDTQLHLDGDTGNGSRSVLKRQLDTEKLPYRPHNSAFSLESVAPATMVEAMDNALTQIEAQYGNIDEFVRAELGYGTIEELHQALAAEQIDSVAMAIYQMKQGQALIIGDQTGVGKGRQMAALIRWAVKQGEKPIFITQKADLFSDIYRDLVDVGSGDLVPFIFNDPSGKENRGEMVDGSGKVVYKGLTKTRMQKVLATGKLPDEYDYAVLTYSQIDTGDEISRKEAYEAAKKSGKRGKKSKDDSRISPKAPFLRAIAKDNYLFLDESHTAAGSSNTGAYMQSILRDAKAATFASATFAKRPDTMPLYAIRTAMNQAKIEPDKMISIIEKGGVTLQEIMSRELTNAGQMVRRERDMSDVVTDWKIITDPETVRRARENYDRTIEAFNAIIKFQEDYVKPMIKGLDMELAFITESAGVKRGTNKMGVDNTPFASKTYNYTKQLMLALKVDAVADEVEAEIKAGHHPVIALESTMESSIDDYATGEIIDEPTFGANLLKGLGSVMQYTIKGGNGKDRHEQISPQDLGPAGEKAYYELRDFIRESTKDVFISPLDAIIERLNDKGYKVGELTGRDKYVERKDDGRVVVKKRTNKDKKKMQREFNNGTLDVLILNKSASTGISLHASKKFSDQRQRSMIIAQPLSDINDYMQMIGRIDRTGQVHRGYYINLGLPVPAENRFLMMLSTKLKSLNANTTTSQDSESNDVEAPDLLNKYGSQVVVEYLRDNVDIYEKMGAPLKKGEAGGGGSVKASELDDYKPKEDDARKVTGSVALLTTKEQEEFYNDVVRRYNELIKYLNDTGSNDLKITVMPLRAKTIGKRVSSEGLDPNGNNPFARNSFVEKVEMDVLRKPMKADEIRKAIEQINRGIAPTEYLASVFETINKEDEARKVAEEERYEKAKKKAAEDITKHIDKINGQKKRSEEEKRVAIDKFIAETNDKVETKHNDNILRINQSSEQTMRRLKMFEVGMSYLMPDNLESKSFDSVTPAIFCGYKTRDSKITASTTLAVFATLDGRRRIEIKLSQIDVLQNIYKVTNDNWDAARATTLDNWDGQIPNETRKTGFIMTGNILQAIADTQDEHGGFKGQLISYTDIDGNIHDGILMPDKWNISMLKTSGAPLISRLQQIKDYTPVTSHDEKVSIMGSRWSNTFYLTVPKTKKDGAVFYENKTLLRAAGGNFYPYRGKLRADIPEEKITEVVKELTKLGVKVKEERTEDDDLLRSDEDWNGNPKLSEENLSEEGEMYRIREDEPPTKTGIGYKVFVLKNGELYPPMVANPNGEPTPVGVWLDADAAPIAGQSKTGRNQVKAGGKGTQGGSGKLAYRPGWHLGEIPYALQFNRVDENGNKTLFPANFVWAEVEYADDVDYQEEAMSYGYNKNGKFQHSYAGLPMLPKNGSYRYRTNPNPTTDPWIITGAMRVNRLLTPTEVDEIVKMAGREPQQRQEGAVTDAEINQLNEQIDSVERGDANNGNYVAVSNDDKAEHARQLAERLNLGNVEIVTSDMVVGSEKRKRAKGVYSKSTGKITIIVDNNSDLADIEQTLLHEAVAHYGLRKLFGDDFNTFLDDVYRNVDAPTRAKISRLAHKNNWNLHTATEEYLATLAEDTNFEAMHPTAWEKIRSLFNTMLRKLGFTRPISDNELRYQLWRSYQNLLESRDGTTNYFISEARDNHMQQRLGVGEFYRTSDMTTSERAEAIKQLTPIVITPNSYNKEELRKIYNELPDVKKDGRNIKFYHSAFKKIYKDGGLFAQVIPQLDEVLKQSILAYSEQDNQGGMVRKDGTVHKEHPNTLSYDNYVGKVGIGDEIYYVRMTIQNDKNELSGMHSCFVTSIELYNNTDDKVTNTENSRVKLDTTGIVDTKLQQFFENSKSELTDIDNPNYQPDILGKELYLDAVASEKPLTEKDEDVLLRPASIMNGEPTWDERNESFGEYARRYAEWAHDKQVYENISGATIPPFPRWDKEKISLRDYMEAFREWRQASNIAELAQLYGEEIRAQHNRWRRFIRKRIDEFKALESFYKYFNKNHEAEINSANDAYNDEFRKLARAEHFYTQEFYNKPWNNLKESISKIIRDHKSELLHDKVNGVGAFVWHNVDTPATLGEKRVLGVVVRKDEHLNGKPLTALETLEVYTQAKDVIEAEKMGLPDRGRGAFVRNLGYTPEHVVARVEAIIGSENVNALWDSINASTRFSLDYMHKHGIITDDTYNNYAKRKHYVPERGWRERDMHDYNEYKNSSRGIYDTYNPVMVRAKGRTSLAASPFAYIQSIAHSTVMSAEKNNVKKKFLQFCLENQDAGRKTGAFHVSKVYLMNTKDADGNTIQVLKYGSPTDEMYKHDEEIDKKIYKLFIELQAETTDDDKRNEIMKQIVQLQDEKYLVKAVTDSDIAQRTQDEKRQHMVSVKVDGETYLIELQDELVANAINGIRNGGIGGLSDNEVVKKASRLTRLYSSMKTQYNIEFSIRNAIRDYLFATFTNPIRHGFKFTGKAMANAIGVLPTLAYYLARGKNIDKAESGLRGIGVNADYLREFLESGAMTGFAYLSSRKDIDRQFKKELEALQRLSDADGVHDKLTHLMAMAKTFGNKGVDTLSFLTELSELAIRYAQFKTARESGMSIEDSATSAKEVSTNFNRKGESMGLASSLYSFMNATIQGTVGIIKLMEKNPKKNIAMLAVEGAFFTALGYILTSLFGDDPEDEVFYNDYDRYQNMIFGNVKIPYPHFYRMFSMLGVNTALVEQGRKSEEQAAYDIFEFILGDILPSPINIGELIDYDEAKGNSVNVSDHLNYAKFMRNVTPSFIQPITDIMLNKNYFGGTIVREPFMSNDKEKLAQSKLYKNNTNQLYIDFANALKKATGGNPKLEYKGKGIDINPSALQYLSEQYMSGSGEFMLDAYNLFSKLFAGEKPTVAETPIIRKFTRPYQEEKVYISEYFDLYGKLSWYEQQYKDALANDKALAKEMKRDEKHKLYKKCKRILDRCDRPKFGEELKTDTEDVANLMEANAAWNKQDVSILK